MKPLKTQSIVSKLDELGVPPESRSHLLAVAVARALGYQLAIPSSKVDNPYSYFAETHKFEVEKALADINERVVINIDATSDLVSRIFTFRYRMVHEVNSACCREFLDAMIRVGNRDIPPAVSELLTKHEQNDTLDILARFVSNTFAEEG